MSSDITKRIESVLRDVNGIEFEDTAARDAICELASCLYELSSEVDRANRAAFSAANAASCLANGIIPD